MEQDLAAHLSRLRGKLAQHDMEVAAGTTPTIYRHEGEVEAARRNADLVRRCCAPRRRWSRRTGSSRRASGTARRSSAMTPKRSRPGCSRAARTRRSAPGSSRPPSSTSAPSTGRDPRIFDIGPGPWTLAWRRSCANWACPASTRHARRVRSGRSRSGRAAPPARSAAISRRRSKRAADSARRWRPATPSASVTPTATRSNRSRSRTSCGPRPRPRDRRLPPAERHPQAVPPAVPARRARDPRHARPRPHRRAGRKGAVENSTEILKAAGVRHAVTLTKARNIDRLSPTTGCATPPSRRPPPASAHQVRAARRRPRRLLDRTEGEGSDPGPRRAGSASSPSARSPAASTRRRRRSSGRTCRAPARWTARPAAPQRPVLTEGLDRHGPATSS
jgi:hypothetical protein